MGKCLKRVLLGWVLIVAGTSSCTGDCFRTQNLVPPQNLTGSKQHSWSEKEIREGEPWIEWIDQKLAKNSQIRNKRIILYVFLRTLFDEDKSLTYLTDDYPRAFFGLPEKGLPDQEGFNRIVVRVNEVWQQYRLDQRHGPLEYWLSDASLYEQDYSLLIRSLKRVRLLKDPLGVLFYQVLAISAHIRNSGPHRETVRHRNSYLDTYLDNEILLDQLLTLVAHFIALDEGKDPRLQEPVLERENLRYKRLQYKKVTQRTLLLWGIATGLDPGLDPDLYFKYYSTEWVFDGKKTDYRHQLIQRLKVLTYPEKKELIPVDSIVILLQQILETPWADFGLDFPWMAHGGGGFKDDVLVLYPNSILKPHGIIRVTLPLRGEMTLNMRGRFINPCIRDIDIEQGRVIDRSSAGENFNKAINHEIHVLQQGGDWPAASKPNRRSSSDLNKGRISSQLNSPL